MEPENQPTNQNPQPMEKPVKKCKHMPIIIILAILAIGGLGFGGFELWQNMQKDNEIKDLQTENMKIEEQKEELGKDLFNDNIPEAQDDNEEKVIELVVQIGRAIYSYIGNEHLKSPEIKKGNGIIYKDNRLSVATSLDKSFLLYIKPNDEIGEGELLKNINDKVVVPKLESLGFQKYDYNIEYLSLGSSDYGNAENNIVCHLDSSVPYYFECGDVSWISDDTINLVNELSEGNSHPYISAKTSDITDSPVAPYQRIYASGIDYFIAFYRKSQNDKWIFAFAGQAAPNCEKFNTEDLKKAFVGTSCFDEEKNENDFVSFALE